MADETSDIANIEKLSFFVRYTEGSRLMRISLVRISLLRFFKTITKICLMRFYVLSILLPRSIARNLANAIFG